MELDPNPSAAAFEPLNNDCTTILPETPFENIALTFSGGGFRAASFSLGVLSYLNRCYLKNEEDKLINHVKFITSTSGGSITNGLYSISAYSNQNFDFTSFYHELRNSMTGEDLLQRVFEILKDDRKWTEQGILQKNDTGEIIKKPRNLINAFAKAYDEILFKGRTLDCIYSCTHNPYLEEVCFNTTEFNNGLNFYFQIDGKTSKIQKRGNGYLKFKDPDVIRHIKISDIVAASSCFPGGFEPVIYPNDFVHQGLTDVNKMLAALSYHHNNPLDIQQVSQQPFALMDGGIADNMGIRSVMIEDDMRISENKGRFDLILACDVTSYFNDPLDHPAPAKDRGISLQGIINIFKFSTVFFLLCLALIIFSKWAVAGYLFIVPSFIMSLIYLVSAFKLAKLSKKESGGVAKMGLKYLDYFLKLPYGVLAPMLAARWKSSVQLISELFLKQIRRGQYDNLFTKPRLVHRAISCLIYEFSKEHQERRVAILETKDRAWWPAMRDRLMPDTLLQQTANDAKTMGTTLWFDKGDVQAAKRDKVIATGQFTVCYNLIKHIHRLEVLDPRYKENPALQRLKIRLLADWDAFQINPMVMVNKLGF